MKNRFPWVTVNVTFALTLIVSFLFPLPVAVAQTAEAGEPPAAVSQTEQDIPKQVRVLPLQAASFSDVKDTLAAFLSPEGSLSYIEFRHALLIHDKEENIERISEILKQLDRPPVNIRITVIFDGDRVSRDAGVGVETGGISVTRTQGGRTEVIGDAYVTGRAGTRTSSSTTSQFLVTRNNLPARIWVGESVARPIWTFEYGVRRGWWRRDMVYQDIGASLWIHPRVIGDNLILVDVYPRITVEGRNPLSVNAQELSTQVMVSDRGTVQLGGLSEEQREAYRYLFGIGSIFNGHRLTISLQAEIIGSRGY